VGGLQIVDLLRSGQRFHRQRRPPHQDRLLRRLQTSKREEMEPEIEIFTSSSGFREAAELPPSLRFASSESHWNNCCCGNHY